jgi:hypothetical protein
LKAVGGEAAAIALADCIADVLALSVGVALGAGVAAAEASALGAALGIAPGALASGADVVEVTVSVDCAAGSFDEPHAASATARDTAMAKREIIKGVLRN